MIVRRLNLRNCPGKRHQTLSGSACRRGTATIETAITIPLIAFLTFGAIELSDVVFLRQTVKLASYEGARSVSIPGSSEARSQLKIGEVMTVRGANNYTVQFSPAVTLDTPRGTMVTVTVRGAASNLRYAPFRIFTGNTIEASTTMVRQ